MSKTFGDLTEQQQKNYEQTLQKMGIKRASVLREVIIDKPLDTRRDPAHAWKTHTIVVRDLAHMKEILGVPDTRYTTEKQPDSFISYPRDFSPVRLRILAAAKEADTLQRELTGEERTALDEAARAYVLGNSTKVPQPLVGLVNRASFPVETAVFAADDLIISDRVVIAPPPSPHVIVAGTITIIKPDGQLVGEGVDLSIQAQHIVVRES
jgi:hypothetical protein